MTIVSSKTIFEWSLFIRQMLADTIDFSDVKIGYSGVVVEADETNWARENTTKVIRFKEYGLLQESKEHTEKMFVLSFVKKRY